MLSAMFFLSISFFFFFKIIYLFIFRERGREGEKEGEQHHCVVAPHVPPTGDLAHNPRMCPDWESNWSPFPSQSGAQSTEPHQPGPLSVIFAAILFPVPPMSSALETVTKCVLGKKRLNRWEDQCHLMSSHHS